MDKIIKDDNLGMLEINKLLSFNFYIPSYQRGYRWTKTEVNALLEDIYEFGNQNHTPEEYYCLQPIVVKEKIIEETKYWEIIDGQQRLTTILIILYYFNQKEFRNPRDIFSIKFQTRPSSNSFLENIENEELALKNIDYFHMHQSYITIKKWFEEKTKISPTKPGSFYKTLVDAVNVIWYEIIDNENPAVIENAIDVFTRINMGKIPLTNSELVKALFLKKGNFKEHQIYTQIKIANEWDEIEKKLQNDSFWYFIYNTKNPITYENRIEYIFDLLKDKKIEHEEYHTFNKFLFDYVKIEKDQKGKHVEDTWLEIKNNFQCLEEWYNNSELYHLIGFLIEYNYDIVTLQKNKVGLSKIKFVEFLKDQISELFKDINIEDLVYKQHNPDIKKTLLLFNIITIVSTQKAEVRFPFDKYKKEKWDIEHVNSQTDKKIDEKDRKDWALDMLEYFTGEKGYSDNFANEKNQTEKEIQHNRIEELLEHMDIEYCNRLIAIIKQENKDDGFFNKLYSELKSNFKEDQFKLNDSISNLALLDESTNRSYKNAMFPIKRKHIISNDQNGIFVPICTKNLFLKYYSKQMSGVMYWKNSDASEYLNAMKKTLSNFLTKTES